MNARIRLTPSMRDVLCNLWDNGSGYPVDRNAARTYEALEERDYIEHVSWGRWQLTPLGETIARQLTQPTTERTKQ
ncbi:MAG: hypothetical protein E7D48_04075 [Bifidobacterium scardovii]|jgi:hypothetical protein|uniref:hypothetical protein n=1 Tax=Bifidobacterium scardovii TaxID=158787 RepID=UPI00205E2207|nr:hypothetical protein [Bifidobacterium scardovii]MDU2421279.1 hypothetical protein [Bifidobacterium scardovii]DAZ29437.1 MAG TPA: SloR regulator, manganese regulator, DtxR [Caudoviricetes sp.]